MNEHMLVVQYSVQVSAMVDRQQVLTTPPSRWDSELTWLVIVSIYDLRTVFICLDLYSQLGTSIL